MLQMDLNTPYKLTFSFAFEPVCTRIQDRSLVCWGANLHLGISQPLARDLRYSGHRIAPVRNKKTLY